MRVTITKGDRVINVTSSINLFRVNGELFLKYCGEVFRNSEVTVNQSR